MAKALRWALDRDSVIYLRSRVSEGQNGERRLGFEQIPIPSVSVGAPVETFIDDSSAVVNISGLKSSRTHLWRFSTHAYPYFGDYMLNRVR